jgi:hypothetical protein
MRWADERTWLSSTNDESFDERFYCGGRSHCRHNVGTNVQERGEVSGFEPAPHFCAEPPRIKAAGHDSVTDKNVRVDIEIGECASLFKVGRTQQTNVRRLRSWFGDLGHVPHNSPE